MCQFIESICLQNGIFRNLDYHQNRLNRTRYKNLGLSDRLDLKNFLTHQSLEFDSKKKYKCRVLYSVDFEYFEWSEYTPVAINSIQLIENNMIEYPYKFAHRDSFQLMKDGVEEDEILIVKNGLITDTSFSNILLYDGLNWITPNTYLLNGTMRQSLLDSGKIIEQTIRVEDLKLFTTFQLINAMMNPEESPELDISMIF